MQQNPPDLRPDLARARVPDVRRDGQPTIGMVSLGCPKALVDSERILTRLRAEGTPADFVDELGGLDAFADRVGLSEVRELEERYRS